MGIAGMPPLRAEEQQALEHEYRTAQSRIGRLRSHLVLVAYARPPPAAIAQVGHGARHTVGRAGSRSGGPAAGLPPAAGGTAASPAGDGSVGGGPGGRPGAGAAGVWS